MPKINRIRIANVPYSGKHIVDQLIECYNGENALLNLANGGGKSVLTQMIMQPIIPNVKIHKRKVESYLTSKEPTFVMIEWILDNTSIPTYFLTGIVMNKTITEENNYRVKFFTFINQYKQSNQHDIKNIDFIINEEGMTKYKSYDYCLSELREQEGAQSNIETFTIDEQKRYAQALEQRGIFKEEWKILAKINEKEGGIDDLFEKCEKSDDVINQWILKAISEKLENADGLREMFLNLMTEVMNHEDQIKQKEELEEFKQEADKYIKELAELLENMDKQEIIKKQLEEIALKLRTLISNLEQKHTDLINQIEEKNKSLENIEYEKTSEEYYKLESNLQALTETEKEKIEELKDKEEKKRETETQLKIIKATKIYEEYKELKAEKERAFIAKQRLQEGVQKEYIQNIEYSLKTEYQAKLNNVIKEITRKTEELKQTNEIYEQAKNKKIENEQEYTEIQKNLVRISERIKIFINYEKETLNELNIELIRNILQELDKKEIEKIINKYNEIQRISEQQILENKQKLEENENQIKTNNIEIQEIEDKKEQNIGKTQEKMQEIEIYKTQTEKLREILENFAIDMQRIFDKQTNLVEIERQKEFISKRKNENTQKLNQNKEILYSLKNGGIHVDLKIGKILEKNKVEYETGEEYLKGQNYEYQQKLLKMNPMLPYSYIILKEQDYNKIEELIVNEQINRLTPIILQKEIEKDFKSQNKTIKIIDNIKLECLYNTKAFDEKLKQEFQNYLEEEIEELQEKVKSDETQIIYIQNAIDFVKEYKYIQGHEKILNEQLKELKEQLDNLKRRKAEIELENKKIIEEKEQINEKISEIKKLIENTQNNKNKFKNYLNKNEEYMNLLKEQKEFEQQSEQNKQKEKELNQTTTENKEKIESLKTEINNNKKQQTNLEEKNGKIANIEKGEKIEKTIEELEKIYEEINNEILKNEKEIQDKIENANKNMNTKEKELNKDYQDVKGKYEEKIYNEEEEDLNREKLEKLEKEWKYVAEEKNKITEEKIRIETRIENTNKSLQKLGKIEPLQAYLIKGEYDKREKTLKEHIENIREELKQLEGKLERIKGEKQTIIVHILEEPEYRQVDISNFDYNNIGITELIKELKEKTEENNEKKRNIDNLYNTIANQNMNKDQVIRKFLNNMNPRQNESDFANYYFTYERVSESSKTMEQMIQVLKTTIENIENDKNNIKHHAYMQGKNIYLEMKKISDSSDIKMPNKLRKVSLLEIALPKELDQLAEERINDYIENCIHTLREECKEQENIKQIVEKRIKDWLSDRQLLNIVINTENIGVKLYKIDISDKNSGLKKWEEVIIDNSGGEKLISCLILVLALMQYTRKKVLAKYGDDEKTETSKFLIIDNPFGKMSSTHLLDGLMLILNRFNVQTICLSDISQSSITNQFKIIYQLSLKTGKYTDKIYLTTDKIIKSPDIIENHLLEYTYVKTEQTSLF